MCAFNKPNHRVFSPENVAFTIHESFPSFLAIRLTKTGKMTVCYIKKINDCHYLNVNPPLYAREPCSTTFLSGRTNLYFKGRYLISQEKFHRGAKHVQIQTLKEVNRNK